MPWVSEQAPANIFAALLSQSTVDTSKNQRGNSFFVQIQYDGEFGSEFSIFLTSPREFVNIGSLYDGFLFFILLIHIVCVILHLELITSLLHADRQSTDVKAELTSKKRVA